MRRALALAALALGLVPACERVRLALEGERAGEEEDAETSRASTLDERGRLVLSTEQREALALATATAEAGVLTTRVVRYGKVVVRPQDDALVVAPVTGRLSAPLVLLGATVADGDALVHVEPLVDTASRASLDAERRQLQGQMKGARAQIDAETREVSRISALVSAGLATEADRARAEATLATEQARLDGLRRASEGIGRATRGRLELRAPTHGLVVTLDAIEGALVQQGTVVARIVEAGPRWIDVAVPVDEAVGSGYVVRGADGELAAELLTRGSLADPRGTRTDRLTVTALANGLLVGATVAVEVLRDARGVLVPAPAVVRRGREALVLVEVEPDRFVARPVQVVAHDDARVVVASGLAAGERVVTRGASALLGELALAPAVETLR